MLNSCENTCRKQKKPKEDRGVPKTNNHTKEKAGSYAGCGRCYYSVGRMPLHGRTDGLVELHQCLRTCRGFPGCDFSHKAESIFSESPVVLQDKWQDCTHRILRTFADRRAGCCRPILSRSTFAERFLGGGADGGEVNMDWADYVWGMDNKVHPCLRMIRRSSGKYYL